ncbi:hypothetical protein [Streptomyces sp. NPDC094049]|uniref:hypothetical protein n=1 Tax=Streptomyces sp. NPDC094049 TaxID=3154987 RepID=UPI003321205D
MLTLRHGIAPATPHALPLHDAIDFAGLGLSPVTEKLALTVTASALAGINSFGPSAALRTAAARDGDARSDDIDGGHRCASMGAETLSSPPLGWESTLLPSVFPETSTCAQPPESPKAVRM